MSNNYEKVPSLWGEPGEEGYRTNGDFEILEKNYKERLLELIIENYDSDEIRKRCDDDFYNEYKSYVELYSAIIHGETTYYSVEKEIFETLAKEGYINNGLLNSQHYYKTNDQQYCISKPFYENVIDGNEKYQTKDEIFDNLIKNGVVVKIAENTYKYA